MLSAHDSPARSLVLSGKPLKSIVFAVFTLLMLSPVRAGEAVGSIKALKGTARIYRGVTQLAAAVGVLVMLGDKIETLADAEMTLLLRSGTELKLGESSSLIIDQNVAKQPAIVRLVLGRLRAWVNATVGAGVIFAVHTPNAVAGVRGTDFEVVYIEGKLI
jgi:hypothetical protein